MIRTLVVTFIILRFDDDRRIFALVFFSIFTGIGFLLSPLLAKTAMQQIGFNAAFIIPVVLAVTGYFMVKKHIVESRASYDFWRPDAIGLAVWTLGLCLMIYAGVLMGGLGWTSPLVLAGFGAGAALLLGTNWLSDRSSQGKRRFKLRYDQRLGVAIFAGIVLNLALYAITVQVFNFMNRVQNFSPIISGIGLAPILVGALVSLQVVKFIRLWELKSVLAAGFLVLAFTAFILSVLQPDVSYLVLLASLLLFGFGFILANSPRLLLLSTSVPRNLAATVQSIGSATAHLGSALAYSFMMTLLEGFGIQAYAQTLEEFGLTQYQIAIRLSNLARASEEISILAPSEEEVELFSQIDFWIKRAYSTGLSQAMLVLAAVCLVSAVIVYIGLHRNKRAMQDSIEDQISE